MNRIFRAGLAIALFAPLPVFADTIRVPAESPTIQGAIDVAVNGDTVLVAPGTYLENINLNGKAIRITSESGPAVTMIDGGGLDSVVRIENGEDSNTILQGFTIQNGDGGADSGGGLHIDLASPTIIGNRIVNNTGCAGTGVMVVGAAPVTIPEITLFKGNVIDGNANYADTSLCSGTIGGGGVSALRVIASRPSYENQITNNTDPRRSWRRRFDDLAGRAGVCGQLDQRQSGNGCCSLVTRGGGIYLDGAAEAIVEQNRHREPIRPARAAGSLSTYRPARAEERRSVIGWPIQYFRRQQCAAAGSAIYSGGVDSYMLLISNNITGPAGSERHLSARLAAQKF